MRSSFVFDQNKCTGCHACRLACTIENELPLRQSWRQIYTFNPRHLPAAPVFHLSLACNHCEHAACMAACPALAYSRDTETGAVLLDSAKCIGCRYCSWACPYDAPQYDRSAGVMTKCTFCVERLRAGQIPACADLCPTGALTFAQLEDEEIAHDVEGFPQSDLGPAIRIVPWSGGPPLMTHDATDVMPIPERNVERIGLASEWPLLAFTFIVAALFGAVAAEVVQPQGVSPVAFLGTALLGLALSGVHLGRRLRAWRAVLNVAHSWLSREVLFVGLFVLAGALYLTLTPEREVIGWVAVALGLVALFSVDMVYRLAVRAGPRIPHSASLVLTGPLLAGVLLVDPAFVVVFGVSKLVLYVWRKVGLARERDAWRPWATAVRIGFGFVVPAVLWLASMPGWYGLMIPAVLLGEFVDRAEFYAEVDLVSPQRQMRVDLGRRVEAVGRTMVGPP